MKLHEALLGCSTGQLRRVAEAWGVPNGAGTLRHELVDLVGRAILAGVRGDDVSGDRDADSERVLAALVRAHCRHDADLLVRRLAAPNTDPDDDSVRLIEQQIGYLVDRGL